MSECVCPASGLEIVATATKPQIMYRGYYVTVRCKGCDKEHEMYWEKVNGVTSKPSPMRFEVSEIEDILVDSGEMATKNYQDAGEVWHVINDALRRLSEMEKGNEDPGSWGPEKP